MYAAGDLEGRRSVSEFHIPKAHWLYVLRDRILIGKICLKIPPSSSLALLGTVNRKALGSIRTPLFPLIEIAVVEHFVTYQIRRKKQHCR